MPILSDVIKQYCGGVQELQTHFIRIIQPKKTHPNSSLKISQMESSQPFPTETNLSDARKNVRDLAIKIEKSNSRTQKQHKQEEKEEDSEYTKVMKEIEHIKQEMGKLKLDMKRVLEEKKRAENVFKASSSKSYTLSSAVERIKKEIEELDEEQVLVEIARIEAIKECEAIEAQKKEEATRYQTKLEEIKRKTEEIVQTKNTPDLLQMMNVELESAKAELEEIKREGFGFMTSMDVIRNELKIIREELSRLEKEEEKRDLTIETLNSKILKGKAKLELVNATTEKANSIASNLSITVDQLRAESETVKKEKEIIIEEIEKIKLEIPKTESGIELSGKQLESVMEELKNEKLWEFKALENLKNLIDSTVQARDPSSLNSTTITITSFEYEYLTGKAGGAKAVSDKKVAAARAWVEALKANEKEILMKVEMVKREISEIEVMEEDLWIKRRSSIDGGVKVLASPRRSMYKIGNMTPGRRRSLKLLSPATRQAIRSASFSKKREKATSNLAKLLDDEDDETGVQIKGFNSWQLQWEFQFQYGLRED
ncbi:unnamed protein product [Lactuca virosa]|uniref:Protein PLASTID MOVEMENT IMPAIRED 2 n=1 Tax=Lactuca virosa TaxID=75947 RepID=A0AAU9M3P3_9ASTR|nr:unnamed protein product [Lactuca virosa]